jgi:hypothetical protein
MDRYQEKGGKFMQLPFEPYENDAVEFGDQLQNTLMKLNENIHGYSVGITIYYEEMGTNHMFIKRLRDELSYQYQVTASPRLIIAQRCTYFPWLRFNIIAIAMHFTSGSFPAKGNWHSTRKRGKN